MMKIIFVLLIGVLIISTPTSAARTTTKEDNNIHLVLSGNNRQLSHNDYCVPLGDEEVPGVCKELGSKPNCVPYRSPDYCPLDKSFPLLIEQRTGIYRNDPDFVESFQYWFHKLESKLAGYAFSVSEGVRAPKVYYCSSDIVKGLGEFVPPATGFVVRATNLHSDVGTYVLPEGYGGVELIRGSKMTMKDIQDSITETGATKILIEEYIAGPGGSGLPVEVKVHMFNGQVGSINVVYNKGTSCACWAEVDEQFNRLDKYGCFTPGGTEVAKGVCYDIDYETGSKKPKGMKGLPFCDEVVKPDNCVLEDLIKTATKLSKKIGVYTRIDFFVSGEREVIVQEYSFDHMHGTRHCSAKPDPSGCINSCFLGQMWQESVPDETDVPASIFGGPLTPKSKTLEDFCTDSGDKCSFIMGLKYSDKYESSCLTPSPPLSTNKPTYKPTSKPSEAPVYQTTYKPTPKPSDAPIYQTTYSPTYKPTSPPTYKPTYPPTYKPTDPPTYEPTYPPTYEPTHKPTDAPSLGEQCKYDSDIYLNGQRDLYCYPESTEMSPAPYGGGLCDPRNWGIEFVSDSFDPITRTSTFVYKVSNDRSVPPAQRVGPKETLKPNMDIDTVTIGWFGSCCVKNASYPGYSISGNKDPDSCVSGITFKAGGVGMYSITVDGFAAKVGGILASIKGGDGFCLYSIMGPLCYDY